MKNLDKINEKFSAMDKVADSYFDIRVALQKECHNFLMEVLSANGGEIIDEVDTYIAYDGGNHPEYASTMSNDILRIYLEDGKIWFDLEDEEKYAFDRVLIEDLMWVCKNIMANIKINNEDGE